MARIGDGTYDFTGDEVRLVSGPKSTADLLRELAQVVKDSVAAGEAPEKTIERIGEIDRRLLRFRKYAGPTLIAIIALIDHMGRAKTVSDIYDALMGNKAKQESAQRVQDAKEGTRQALETYYASKEYQEFKQRYREDLSLPDERRSRKSGLGLNLPQLFIDFPETAKKLSQNDTK